MVPKFCQDLQPWQDQALPEFQQQSSEMTGANMVGVVRIGENVVGITGKCYIDDFNWGF